MGFYDSEDLRRSIRQARRACFKRLPKKGVKSMPCYNPLKAWVSDEPNANGKFELTWDIRKANPHKGIVDVPCGKCDGCRLDHSRSWAVRCVHEASLHDKNCFITLTYNNEHLPPGGSLVKSDFQKFMKRLRKRCGPVRFFQCGEYGEHYGRPHFHACLFGYDFPDRKSAVTDSGAVVETSEILQDLWSDDRGAIGFVQVGDVTFASVAYVARYVLKKQYGAESVRYQGKIPEYVTMSRRPGIGDGWFKKFYKDIYPDGYVVFGGGIKCKPPKFYERQYALDDPESYGILKVKRKEKAVNNPHNEWKRLKVREKAKQMSIKKLRRNYEAQSV